MNIYGIIQFICGISFFLFGMQQLSESLERLAGGSLERVLKQAHRRPFVSLLLGTAITAVVQSSSATSVMLVGLVGSGIMQFSGTLYIIFGANIGTTVTAWILSLTGLESDSLAVSLLKPENFMPFAALAGIFLLLISKKSRSKDIGKISLTFTVLIYGMKFMTEAVKPLTSSPEFTFVISRLENPLLSLVTGIVITSVIQSSSAATGILQAFALTGDITYSSAVPLIMGINIGTCITTVISCIGSDINAKRVAAAHTAVNVIGTAALFPIFAALNSANPSLGFNLPVSPTAIAVIHSIFNISATALLLPFVKWLEKLICTVIRDSTPKKAEASFMDRHLLLSPSVAVGECMSRAHEMAVLTEVTVKDAVGLIHEYSTDIAKSVEKNEHATDAFEDSILSFLVGISESSLSEEDSRAVLKILHTVSDFERMCDHSLSIARGVCNLPKCTHALAEPRLGLCKITAAVAEITEITVGAFVKTDISAAVKTEPLEQVIDRLAALADTDRISRIKSGEYTVEQGVILGNVLTDLKRISDHCSNISATVIELEHGKLDAHGYLSEIKRGDTRFTELYARYSKKYLKTRDRAE